MKDDHAKLKEIRQHLDKLHEKHIQCGNWEMFTESLRKSGVERAVPPQNPVAQLYGFKIIENTAIPKNRAVLVDADGSIIEWYDL